MAVTVALFVAGISMKVAGVLVWAWGVRSNSLGVTESRLPLFEYPESSYAVTEEITNFDPTSR